ncbi:MAG TPA: GNAT family N-acetyltransferase [Sphingomicrobium sp.]|nr:GNAT family N-acetyltransferase [Sphingomicrobium sp.]
MSDPKLDALAETARNRGLKLLRSRVRTPGKRRFGKAGLTDTSGTPVFGMDAKGQIASPEAVEDYLRKLEAEDWGASLGAAGQVKKPKATAANDRKAAGEQPASPPPPRVAPKAKPNSKPKLEIRGAKPSDAVRLAELIGELAVKIDAKQVRKNLALLKKSDDTPLVAVLGKEVVGLCGLSRRIAIHRNAPLGRITALVVAKEVQGQGIGRKLVEAAENWMRKRGCWLVEVTSNDRRAEAHAFYRHMGYERTSIRFAKEL